MEPKVILTNGLESFVEKEYDQDISPVSALIAGSPIEFQIPGSSIFYTSLASSYFDVQCKITRPDGTDLAANAAVGPVNLLAHSLFSNIELYINGKQVTEPTHHYAYRAYLETLINFSPTVQARRLRIEGWTMDLAGSFGVTNAHDGANTGLVARHNWFALSRVVRFLFRPHLDLFHQDSDLPPNTDIRIRFIPNPSAFCLMATDNATAFQMRITSIRLWLRTREMSSQCLLNHQSQLHTDYSYYIPMPCIRIKTLSIPVGSIRQEFDNVYLGKLPHRIIFAMVQDTHMNGTYNSNPFNFQNFGISSLALRVNGELIPRIAYKPDFDADTTDYFREYLGTLSALDLDKDSQNTFALTPAEWASGSTFFAFKLFPNLSQYRPAGTVRIEIQFSQATGNLITILLLSESTASIEIDKYKNILFN